MGNINKIQIGNEEYNISDPTNANEISIINNKDIQIITVSEETLIITTKKIGD